MEFRILGKLDIVGEGGPLAITAEKQRTLLAMLLLHPNEPVASDALIDALWGETPPPSARKLLQIYVSNLRKQLPPARVRTTAAGYVLAAETSEIDAGMFEQLVAEGRSALDEANPRLALARLTRALDLWRGPPLADFRYEDFAQAEIARLEELHVIALEDVVDARLALGKHEEVLTEIQALVRTHPHRERLRAQLMLALYRSGRQTEALDAYREARAVLLEEGLDPAPELSRLHQAILRQDSSLEVALADDTPEATVPAAATPLIGRARELEQLWKLIAAPAVRLVTLTGPGGAGKTRIALEVAARAGREFANGAVFVEVAAIRDPTLVVPEVARALGVPAGSLADELRSSELLLVVDNVEQVLDAAPDLAALLAAAPRLTLLVTSRAPLHVAGEHEYQVPTLALEDAVELFTTRARQVDSRFDADPAVAEICARLEGLPLAIELAATRVKVLAPTEILSRLERRLDLLTGGGRDAPERQRTVRAAIEWSYDLLTADEQALFAGLASFAGGFTLAAAERVTGAELDAVASLVDKSLVNRSDDGRLSMLETIREFAAERLERREDADGVRRRHAELFLELAESATLAADAEGEQRHDRVIPERENMRTALEWSLASGETALGLQLAVALENFWVTSDPSEGARWLSRLFSAGGEVPQILRGRALRAFGGCTDIAGDLARAEELYEQSLAEFRAAGDERGVGILLHRLGIAAAERDPARARALGDESLAIHRRLGYRKGETQALALLAALEHAEGNTDLALELARESATLAADIGFRWWEAWRSLEVALWTDEPECAAEAEPWALRALALLARMGDKRGVAWALAVLARTSADAGDLERAGRLLGALEAEDARTGTEPPRGRAELTAPLVAVVDDALQRGREEGRQLSLEAAVAYAIGSVTRARA